MMKGIPLETFPREVGAAFVILALPMVFVIGFIFPVSAGVNLNRIILEVVFFTPIVFAATFCTAPKSWLGKRIVLLGDASYSLYLTHFVAVNIVANGFPWRNANVPSFAGPFLAFIAALLLSMFLHRWVELPLTAAFKRKFGI